MIAVKTPGIDEMTSEVYDWLDKYCRDSPWTMWPVQEPNGTRVTKFFFDDPEVAILFKLTWA